MILERSGWGRPGTFQVWAPQENLAGYIPDRIPPEFNLELHGGVVKGVDSTATYRKVLRTGPPEFSLELHWGVVKGADSTATCKARVETLRIRPQLANVGSFPLGLVVRCARLSRFWNLD